MNKSVTALYIFQIHFCLKHRISLYLEAGYDPLFLPILLNYYKTHLYLSLQDKVPMGCQCAVHPPASASVGTNQSDCLSSLRKGRGNQYFSCENNILLCILD